MTLGFKLAIVILAFLAILTVVITVAFRERKHAKTIPADDLEAQRAADGRLLAVIFGAIFGGMMLTLLAAYLLFL